MTSSRISWAARLSLTAALALVAAIACSDAQGPGAGLTPVTPETPEPPETPPTGGPLVVSNPGVTASALGAAVTGTVYVSLPPGSVLEGERVVIRARETGAQVTAEMLDGGFDPVALLAGAGDTLDIRIFLTGLTAVKTYTTEVPVERPPVIVRTDPPPAKLDVPLNAVIRVVFSEPLNAATLTGASVQLSNGGGPVAGTLTFADAAQLTVTFVPALPLAPGTAYTLRLAQTLTDRSGDPLDAPVSVGFVTRQLDSVAMGVYERVTPVSFPGQTSRYVLRDDGNFELQVETPTGSGAYTGTYLRVGFDLVFTFDANSPDWVATGTLDGDSLAVAYNTDMQLSDFEDGVYDRSPDSVATPAPTHGPQLAFVRDGQIFRVNADGSGLVQLSDGPADAEPAWSPDGSRLAFTSDRGGSRDIYVMNADGSNLVRRTNGGYHEAPSWSPDGTRIVYSALVGGSANVYVMSADDNGTGPTAVVGLPGWDNQPAWSPDGTRIAFVTDWVAYDFTSDVFTIAPDGSQQAQLTDGFGFFGSLVQYFRPSWSPDGQRFAVITCLVGSQPDPSGCGGGMTVSLMNTDGSGLAALAGSGTIAGVSWSPDGRTIAFGTGWQAGSVEWVSVDRRARGTIITNGHSPAWRP